MIVLVCGGRDYYNKTASYNALDQLHIRLFRDQKRGITLILQGGAKGADWLARQWADDRGIACREYEADWNTHGRAAGPIRNQQMLDEGKPDVVVAFPGGRGTADMIARAQRAGLTVWEPYK